MKINYALLAGVIIMMAGCQSHDAHYHKISPARVLKDAQGTYIELTEAAIRRLGILDRKLGGDGSIPLSALLYDARGRSSVFVRTGPFVYRRIIVDVARQDEAKFTVKNLSEISAPVVVTGAAELNGTEEGVGK